MKTQQKNRHGLHESDLHLIITASQAIPEIEQLLLFGSRAKGTEKPGSDVDLAIKGKAVTYDTVLQLSDRLNEQLPLPYFFDVINYHNIQEPRLTEHIDNAGIVIFNLKTSVEWDLECVDFYFRQGAT
jgi:uncharacterized protein